MKPTTAHYSLGDNRHGQRITLKEEGGKWSIIKAQANYRDDHCEFEVSVEQLRMIAEHFGKQ